MLVRLVDDEATAIIPVTRISAITTEEKIGRRRSVRVLLQARLNYKYVATYFHDG